VSRRQSASGQRAFAQHRVPFSATACCSRSCAVGRPALWTTGEEVTTCDGASMMAATRLCAPRKSALLHAVRCPGFKADCMPRWRATKSAARLHLTGSPLGPPSRVRFRARKQGCVEHIVRFQSVPGWLSLRGVRGRGPRVVAGSAVAHDFSVLAHATGRCWLTARGLCGGSTHVRRCVAAGARVAAGHV